MPATLSLSPDNHAAIHDLTAQIHRLKAADALRPVHLLLPSAQMINRLRRGLGDGFNVHFLQFYGLARSVLNATRQERIHEIRDTGIRRLVHHLLGQMAAQGELSTFGPVWEKPGFTDVILSWLREMKSQGIHPQAVAVEAERTGMARDRQLALLYQRYQDFLQARSLSDADGLLWLAAECLAHSPGCFAQDGPLFVVGFDQFNPVQLDLLARLTDCFAQTYLYLLWDEGRPAHSLALTRLAETRQALVDRLAPGVVSLPPSPQPPAIAHLNRHLFESASPPAPTPEQVALIEAPSREEEVRTALRAIKGLLLAGIEPAQIALLAPKPGVYARLVETVAQEYGVPVAVERMLGTNPAIAALLNSLRLSPDFPWRQTFDLLRSPYVDCSPWLTPEQVKSLDQLTRQRPVVAGRAQWSHALRPLPLAGGQAEQDGKAEEEGGGEVRTARLSAPALAEIEAGLMALFDHLTPPDEARYADYALWIQDHILGLPPEVDEEIDQEQTPSSLHLLAQSENGPHAQRDHHALAGFLSALRRLVEAADLIDAPGAPVAWAKVRTDLMEIVPAVPLLDRGETAQVEFGPLQSGRGLTPDYLFVLGLSEGEFPTPPAPDVLYAPQERANAHLPLRGHRPGDDASLWWQTVGNVGQRLTLLRPWLDEKGTPWPPSPYWQAVRDALAGLDPVTLPVARALSPQEAASPEELSAVLAAAGASQAPPQIAPLWQQAARANRVIQQRESWQPPGVHEGVLTSDDLLAELERRYAPDHVWSASRLNRYNHCPFGFFAQQILMLDPLPDPEEGLDVRQRGSLLHAVLEGFYREVAALNQALTAGNEAQMLARLDAHCDHIFSQAPDRYGFRPSPLWQQEQAELRRLLRSLVRWECGENGEAARFLPYHQELGFGIGDGTGDGHGPVTLAGGAGRTFRLRGVIDRIDRDREGNLRVIDYKSGSADYSKADIREGRSLQTALYALVAEKLLAAEVVQSHYLHLPNRKQSGTIEQGDPNELLDAALHAATQAIEQIRAGRFPNAPSKSAGYGSLACASWCDLADLCRVSRKSRLKAQRGQEA